MLLRLVQATADIRFQMLDARPMRSRRHEEGVLRGIFQQQLNLGCCMALGLQLRAHGGAVGIELVGHALEEQHAEDVFLVLGGIHLAAQDVAGLEQQVFEFGEGELGHGGCLSLNAG